MRALYSLSFALAWLLSLFILKCNASGNDFDCDWILTTTSEKQAFTDVKAAFNEGKDFSTSCLENTCQKHYFKISEFLIDEYYGKHDIDTLEIIDRQLAILQKNQSSLYKELAKADEDFVVLKPSFRWAQSLDEVFVETKFAHRLDAPACAESFDQKIKMTENYLNLTAKCRRGDDTLQYKFYLKFSDKIDAKQSSWEKKPDGLISITLKKKIRPSRWAKLFSNDNDDKPGRALLWKEVHEKYDSALTEYAKQFREEEDDYDDFDYFVARETGVHLPEKPMKFGKTETIKTEDVTDQIKAVDVTEEMRGRFDNEALRQQLLSGNLGTRSRYYNPDEYEEFDAEDFDHMERDYDDEDVGEEVEDEEDVINEDL